MKTIEDMVAHGASAELNAAVEMWRSNPFSPHAVARLRTTAYQKTVVMKYIDNLICLGRSAIPARHARIHQRGDAALCSRRRHSGAASRGHRAQPEAGRRRRSTRSSASVGALGNALEQIELLIPDAGQTNSNRGLVADTRIRPRTRCSTSACRRTTSCSAYWSTVARPALQDPALHEHRGAGAAAAAVRAADRSGPAGPRPGRRSEHRRGV